MKFFQLPKSAPNRRLETPSYYRLEMNDHGQQECIGPYDSREDAYVASTLEHGSRIVREMRSN